MHKENEKQFFEGKDFQNSPFRALMPEFYPLEYKKYISEETLLLENSLKGSYRILEAGVGIGRLIPNIAPLVKEFIGIDNANRMVEESKTIAKNFSNVKIIKGNIEELNKIFPAKYFDFSICVRNTLGNVENEILTLKQLGKVTKHGIFVTVYLKGTIENRTNWYKTIGIEIKNIDKKNEIFYTKSGLKSKSFSLNDIKKIAKVSGLIVVKSKKLNKVMLWIEMKPLN